MCVKVYLGERGCAPPEEYNWAGTWRTCGLFQALAVTFLRFCPCAAVPQLLNMEEVSCILACFMREKTVVGWVIFENLWDGVLHESPIQVFTQK